jgi:hypothetical protein
LVVGAVVTSQIAGAWLEFVLRKGWPLLRSVETSRGLEPVPESPSAAA